MTVIGYARTRRGQDSAPIRARLTAAGATTVLLDEQVHLHAPWPQLDRALATATTSDTLTVCRLTHLARSLEHLASLLAALDQRGVRLRVLHEHLDTADHGDHLRRATHDVIELLKVWRSEAARNGVAAAAAAGRTPGRRPGPPPLTPEQEHLAQQLQAAGRPITEIADLLGVSRAAMYRAQRPRRATLNDEDSAP